MAFCNALTWLSASVPMFVAVVALPENVLGALRMTVPRPVPAAPATFTARLPAFEITLLNVIFPPVPGATVRVLPPRSMVPA